MNAKTYALKRPQSDPMAAHWTVGLPQIRDKVLVEDPLGEWVRKEDYDELSAYCDKLVAHKDMACLPADLKNLRKANASFVEEVQNLLDRIDQLNSQVITLEHDKYDLQDEISELEDHNWRNS